MPFLSKKKSTWLHYIHLQVVFSIKDTIRNATQQSSHGTTNYNFTESFPWPFSDKILFGSEYDIAFEIYMKKKDLKTYVGKAAIKKKNLFINPNSFNGSLSTTELHWLNKSRFTGTWASHFLVLMFSRWYLCLCTYSFIIYYLIKCSCFIVLGHGWLCFNKNVRISVSSRFVSCILSAVPWEMLLPMTGWDYHDQVLHFDFSHWLKPLYGKEGALDF